MTYGKTTNRRRSQAEVSDIRRNMRITWIPSPSPSLEICAEPETDLTDYQLSTILRSHTYSSAHDDIHFFADFIFHDVSVDWVVVITEYLRE
jgi:hypothetical protein